MRSTGSGRWKSSVSGDKKRADRRDKRTKLLLVGRYPLPFCRKKCYSVTVQNKQMSEPEASALHAGMKCVALGRWRQQIRDSVKSSEVI